MKRALLFSLFALLSLPIFSQIDCFISPNDFNRCSHNSTVSYVASTNDVSVWSGCGVPVLPGEDELFRITTLPGSQTIKVNVTVNQPAYLLWMGNTCGSVCLDSYILNPGSEPCTIDLDITGLTGPFFFRLDYGGGTPLGFDLSVGIVEGMVMMNIPDTRGSFELDDSPCDPLVFKPEFALTYNGAPMFFPLTLSPLFVDGDLCVEVFLRNLSGEEGIKSIEFDFMWDYINVTPMNNPSAGNYNPGTWSATGAFNTFTWEFFDMADNGDGDFMNLPNSCLSYTFCFNVTPISNDPLGTNVTMRISPDGKGTPFNDSLVTGCCPEGSDVCCSDELPRIPGPDLFLEFNDPIIMPLEFSDVDGIRKGNDALINWNTSLLNGVNEFSVERSTDGTQFKTVGQVPVTLDSRSTQEFSFTDSDISNEKHYYKIVAVDLDGETFSSSVIEITGLMSEAGSVKLWPNPTSNEIVLESPENIISLEILDIHGKKMELLNDINKKFTTIDCDDLANGIYFFRIRNEDNLITRKVIIQK